MTFEVDGRAVLEDEDLMKAMYAQGFGYSGWWNAAMLDRLNDMLGGGFLKVEGVLDGAMLAELLPDARTLFATADVNGSLRVSFAEFIGLCIKVGMLALFSTVTASVTVTALQLLPSSCTACRARAHERTTHPHRLTVGLP